MARPVLLLSGLMCVCVRCSSSWLCDNGKTNLIKDLPEPEALLCQEPKLQPELKIPDIHTHHQTTQAADYVCMDTPLRYNHHLPSHGTCRPVEAESGEYLYCPPQRWLHNLKKGALVFLYHPCVSADDRRRLAVLAHACLPHYIVTAHPGLSRHRPFAVVSWGRSLEMSQIALAVCDWMLSISSNVTRDVPSQGAKYNLYLIKPAPGDQVMKSKQEKSKDERLKSLKHCCMESLGHFESKMVLKRSLEHVKPSANLKPDGINRTQSSYVTNNTNEMPTVVQSYMSADNKTKTAMKQFKGMKVTGKQKDLTDRKAHSSTTEGKKHRIKTDTQAQVCGELGQCGLADDQIKDMRMPLHRTDEAMWAAGAVAFILALLTVSVLHTRLYRQCRPSTSLYWHDNQQDYDSVADIIRRRLRKFGRRKRRGSQIRRQECPLLTNSSEDDT